jgi:alkylation response protein AidB-like acyl-CoA dehydrogenase
MDFGLTEEQNAFRTEVRSFLEEEIERGYWKPACDAWIQGFDPGFSKRVAQRSWIGLTWPKEYGGQERSHVDRLILTEEMLRYGAPAACHWFGDRQVGGTILSFGSEELKREFLPRIVAGEAYFGLGMSEPGAGSDLASMQTRAVRDGDHYVIDGQKTWASCASYAHYFDVYARTDADAPRHRGISELIIDAKSPRYLVGEENRGFHQILHQLDYERSGMERLMGNYPLFEGTIRFAKQNKLSQEPVVRNKLAQLEIEFEVGRLLIYRVALVMDEGRTPNWESAMSKAYATEFEKRLASVAMEVLGLYGQLMSDSDLVPLRGMAPHSYLGSKGYSLQAGTTEILKNILAVRGLGLPSS